jgi:hypothetical protein
MTTDPIARFFDSFAQQSNRDDFEAQAAQFADTFLAASPNGAKCVSSRDFALALPKRKQLFASLGLQATKLVALDETVLDDRYVLVKTRWQMTFSCVNTNAEEVLADSTFILDTALDEYKIVLYLAHQDILEVLRNRGFTTAQR